LLCFWINLFIIDIHIKNIGLILFIRVRSFRVKDYYFSVTCVSINIRCLINNTITIRAINILCIKPINLSFNWCLINNTITIRAINWCLYNNQQSSPCLARVSKLVNFSFNIHIVQFNGFMMSETITTLYTRA